MKWTAASERLPVTEVVGKSNLGIGELIPAQDKFLFECKKGHYLFDNRAELIKHGFLWLDETPDQSFSREEVVLLMAQFGDHFWAGMNAGKWYDPQFKGNIIIATEFLDNKLNTH